jgi:hypothetical protein
MSRMLKRLLLELGSDRTARPDDQSSGRVWLRDTAGGWSLLDARGDVLFQGAGLAGRRQCLEFASARGVVAVLS